MTPTDLLTPQEYARYRRCSVRTLDRERAEGRGCPTSDSAHGFSTDAPTLSGISMRIFAVLRPTFGRLSSRRLSVSHDGRNACRNRQ